MVIGLYLLTEIEFGLAYLGRGRRHDDDDIIDHTKFEVTHVKDYEDCELIVLCNCEKM